MRHLLNPGLMGLIAIAVAVSGCGGSDDPGTDPGPGAGGGSGGGGAVPAEGLGSGLGEGVASVALRSLSYTDSQNWRYRMELQTATDATLDSELTTSRYEQYTRNAAGAITNWSFGPDPAGAQDLFFNGGTWRPCPQGFRTTLSGFDANGQRSFNYCDRYASGTESVVPMNVSGMSMADVIAGIRAQTGGDGFVEFARYGPDNPSVLGNAVFPPNAWMQTVLTTVDVFNPRYANTPADRVRAWLPSIAAGGDTRNGGAPNCNLSPTAQPDEVSPIATNLEQMVASAQGKPCIFPGNAATNQPVEPNEFWQATTQEYGVLQGADVRPPGSGDYYLREPSMRVAFTAADEATFYRCLVRDSTPPSVRNCTVVGIGSFVIRPAGDGRVLSMTNIPQEFVALGRDRVFIERNGAVYAGIQERAGARDQIGFNDVATRALLNTLRIPVPVPMPAPN